MADKSNYEVRESFNRFQVIVGAVCGAVALAYLSFGAVMCYKHGNGTENIKSEQQHELQIKDLNKNSLDENLYRVGGDNNEKNIENTLYGGK